MKNSKRKQWNEAAFTRWFCKRLERVGAVIVPIVGNTMQRSGLPDRYVAHLKFRGWLEFKKADGRLRDVQRIVISRLQQVGDVAMVVRWRADDFVYVEDVDGWLYASLDLRTVLCLPDPPAAKVILSLLEKALAAYWKRRKSVSNG